MERLKAIANQYYSNLETVRVASNNKYLNSCNIEPYYNIIISDNVSVDELIKLIKEMYNYGKCIYSRIDEDDKRYYKGLLEQFDNIKYINSGGSLKKRIKIIKKY